MFPTQLRRLQFLARWLLWTAAIACVAFALEFMPALQPGAFVVWVVLAMVYGVVGLYIPRMKNAGMSPLLLLLLLVPLANLVIVGLLFLAPPKK